MAWAKLDDHMDEHLADLSADAFRLYLCAIPYSRRHELGGRLRLQDLKTIARAQKIRRLETVLEEIVKTQNADREQLWEKDGDEFLITGYDAVNPMTSTERVRRHRSQQSEIKVVPEDPISDTIVELPRNADETLHSVSETPPHGRAVPKPKPRPVPTVVLTSVRTTAQTPDFSPTSAEPPSVTGGIETGGWVGVYVDAYRLSHGGADPDRQLKSRIGKSARDLLAGGKPLDIVRLAIERAATRDKSPGVLALLCGEVERELANPRGERPPTENPIDRDIRRMLGTGLQA